MDAINRRGALQLLASVAVMRPVAGVATTRRVSAPMIDAQRLRQSLEKLSEFGRPAGGTFADGVSRVAYSDADIAGRALSMQLMQAAGLSTTIDAAGNLIGRSPGTDPSLKPIVMGSHIDSVPEGGNFDGDVGSMAAIEVVYTLNEERIRTRHPIEVVIWTDEEGSFLGSGAAVGNVPSLFADSASKDGIAARQRLTRIGGDPDRLESARREPASIRCYLELHIEQGGILDQAGVPIGVVDGIVCIDEYQVTIEGFANHAGTTPMPGRQDALIAAAKMVEMVNEVARAEPGRHVATVGKLEVMPNAPNVIPGLVRHTVEIRDLSKEKVAKLGTAIAKRADQIAAETRTKIAIKRTFHAEPALADPALQAKIESAAASLGLKTMHLPSGAGHDAQELAKIGPMAMIFVPSVSGISHSPKEFTRWADCANGANVLLRTLLAVDRS